MSYPDNATASLAQFLFRDSQGAMYIIPRRAFHNGSQYGDAVTIVQDLSGNGNDLTGTAVFDRKPFAVTDQETLNNIRDAQIIRDVDMEAPVGNLGPGCTVVRVAPGWPVEFDDLDINGNYQVTEDFSILIIIDRALTEPEVRVIEEMGKKWGGATFNPLVNYANGEQGAYYAPWDISTLWQDVDRTVPVENYGDPVRVMDDLSPNGNHAVAPTSTARGTYGRMPVGGRRNLTVDSENLASGWDYQGSHLNRQFSLNGYQFNEVEITATSGRRRVFMASGRQMTFAGGEAVFSFLLYKGAGYSSSVQVAAWNLGAGVTSLLGDVDLDAETASGNCTIEKVYDGVYRCAILGAVPTSLAIGLRLSTLEGKMYVSAIQVEAGGVMTPYQRVGNQYDVSQEGVPDVYYIETDGIDDCYQTAPIDLTMYDSTSLAVGVQNLSGGSSSDVVLELSGDSWSNNGAYAVSMANLVGRPWRARHGGTTTITLTGTASANAEVNVLSMSASISEPDLTAILQGELLNTTESQGTGTLGNYSLNLLSRTASSFYFQGRFFGAIIVHPRSLYEEQNRQFLAMKAGVTL